MHLVHVIFERVGKETLYSIPQSKVLDQYPVSYPTSLTCTTHIQQGVQPCGGVCSTGQEQVAMKGRTANIIYWAIVGTK